MIPIKNNRLPIYRFFLFCSESFKIDRGIDPYASQYVSVLYRFRYHVPTIFRLLSTEVNGGVDITVVLFRRSRRLTDKARNWHTSSLALGHL